MTVRVQHVKESAGTVLYGVATALPGSAATSSRRISLIACAGSDSGKWSDWHSASGASITGSMIRDCHALHEAAISRAIDSGRIVAPRPSAITAVSVPADSISAATLGVIPAPAKASLTMRRTTL